MKKNLKISYLKNNLVYLNIITILLYGVGFLISKTTAFNFPINFIGFIYILLVAPLNISIILQLKFDTFIEYFLAGVTIFFTLIAPLYFIANVLLQFTFAYSTILFLNLVLSIIFIFLYYKPSKKLTSTPEKKTFPSLVKNFILKHWPFLLIVLLYLLLHLINYHFYVFMPEWDGYSKLTEIKNSIELNTLETTYRGFFTVAVILISEFTKISPYALFTSWLVALPITLFLVLYRFLNIFKIRNKVHQFIILLTALAIPVLNTEIDIIRPQSVFIILLPIHTYFLFKAVKSNKYSYWLISTLIAVSGLNYHEFFVFTFLLHSITAFVIVFKKYYLFAQDNKDRFIFSLLIIIMFLLGVIFISYFSFLNYFTVALNNIFHQITQTQEWRWWFLNNYSTDSSNQQLGWPGISGTLKYYSYYVSPAIIFIFFLALYLKITKKIYPRITLLYLTMPLVAMLLVYSELLPRLNYIYLPERTWLVTDILLILLLPLLTIRIKNTHSKKIFTLYLVSLTIFSIIGISGTFYITKNKKALTSKNEYSTAQWMKNTTPEGSIFITQIANRPMVEYFANRIMLPMPAIIFEDGNDLFDIKNDIISPREKIAKELKNFQTKISDLSIDNMDDINNIIAISRSTQKLIFKLQNGNALYKNNAPLSANPSVYVLYSNDKFNGIYAQREWWLKANHYGVEIDNLTKKYPLVYNKNDIYIWKIK